MNEYFGSERRVRVLLGLSKRLHEYRGYGTVYYRGKGDLHFIHEWGRQRFNIINTE